MGQPASSWSELLQDANKLARKQRECYKDIHHLLEVSIPELDRKIKSCLRGESIVSLDRQDPIRIPNHPRRNANANPQDSLIRTSKINDNGSKPKLVSQIMSSLEEKPVVSSNGQDSSSLHHNPQHDLKSSKSSGYTKNINVNKSKLRMGRKTMSSFEEESIVISDETDSGTSNGSREMDSVKSYKLKEIESLEGLDHLKPLPLPLNEYFKMNRPDLMARANCRSSHLKQKSERRKQNASSVFASQLAILRQNNRRTKTRSSTVIKRQTSKDYNFITHHNPVKYNFTEREIRQQTNRRYQSLPEVKQKANEEIKSHIRTQNYRNKLIYGRKLMQNRRQGIINYPIIATSDDVSISSCQDDFSSGDFEKEQQYNAFSMN